jgi:predicted TIM-barrel fold metal-dependent hydrolase
MIIDSHTHIGRNTSVKDLLTSMDLACIDKALVIANNLDFGCSNNYLLKEIEPHKDRLYAVGARHINDILYDEEFIKDSISEGKFVAIKFYLGYDHWYPNDARIDRTL